MKIKDNLKRATSFVLAFMLIFTGVFTGLMGTRAKAEPLINSGKVGSFYLMQQASEKHEDIIGYITYNPRTNGGMGNKTYGDRQTTMRYYSYAGWNNWTGYVFCVEAGVDENSALYETGFYPKNPATYVYEGTLDDAQVKRVISWAMEEGLGQQAIQALIWRALGQVKLTENPYKNYWEQYESEYNNNPNDPKFKGEVTCYQYYDKTYNGQRMMSFDYTKAPREGYIGIKSKVDFETGLPLEGVKFGVFSDKETKNKVAELVTSAKGQAITTKEDNLEVGETYYVRELSKAEGQIDGVVPSDKVAKIELTNSTKDNPVWVELDGTEVITNIMETFKFQFDKKDIADINAKLEGVEYKLKVVSLVKDIKNPQFKVGDFVKESITSDKDLILKVKDGKISSPRFPAETLPLGKYELVEYRVPEGTNALLAPTGSNIVFENLGDNEDNGTDDNLKIVENNTSANALAQQNKLMEALNGKPFKDPKLSNTTWGEALPFGLLRITKEDKESHQPLENFEYEVTAVGEGTGIWNGDKFVKSKTYKTNKEGFVITDPLLLGEYKVKEVKAVGNYLLPDIVEKTITVNSAQSLVNAQLVSWENEQQLFDFSLQKKFATKESGSASLEGAKFEVKVKSLEVEGIKGQKQPGEVVGVYTTNAEGKFEVNNLPLGVYTIKEIEAPNGTLLNGNEVTVRGAYDGTQNKKSSDVKYDFSNNTNSINKMTEELKSKLSTVWNALLPQDKIGTINYTNEQLGITPNEKDADNVFFNHIKKGRVEINKHMDVDSEVESGGKTAEQGITFKIMQNGVEVDSFTTNHMGRGASKYLPLGKYTISQSNTVTDEDGNPVVTKIKDFEIEIKEDGQVLSYTLENAQEKMRLRIQKIDEQTGKNILQSGVKFQLFDAKTDKVVTFKQYYPEAKEIDTLELNEKTGYTLTVDKIKGGDYYLKEVAGPEGYTYDPEVKIPVKIPYELGAVQDGEYPIVDITIGAKTEKVVDSSVNNTPQYGELKLHKQGEKLKGWEDRTVTHQIQEQGTVETKEVKTPQANVNLVIKQVVKKEVEVDITEVSEDPNVKPEKKTKKVVKEVEEFRNVKTDKQGKYTEEVTLEGKYTVYGPNKEVLQELTVANGSKGQINVQLPDLTRTEESRKDGEVKDKTFTYKVPKFEKEYLGNAKFELIAKEDIMSYDKQTKFFSAGDKLPIAQKDITLNGKVVYRKGDVITLPQLDEATMTNKEFVDYTITTEDNQPVSISKIPLGTITLKEVQAPEGYKLDETAREYKFTPQERTIKVDLKETEKIENFRQILSLELNKKVVKETKFFGRGGYEYLLFGVYTAEEIGGLAKDSLVGVVKPDANGTIKVSDVLKGKYYFKEISTKDAYTLNENQYNITATYDNNATKDKVEVIKEDVQNTPKEGKTITITKVDVKTGDKISGVPFRLYAVKSDGTKVPVMNGESDLWYTNKEGKIVVKDMPHGNYVWEEAKPAPGYVNEDLKLNVAVSEDSNLEITAPNSPTDIGFRKYDSQTGRAVIGAKLRLEVKNANGEWEVVYVDNRGYVVEEGGSPAEWVSDGEVKNFYGLHVGKEYRLVETEAPKGYSSTEPVTFKVRNEKGVQLTSLSNQMIRAKIKKLDESSLEPVNGATLELYEEGSDKIFVDKVTGKEAKWTTSEENKDGFEVNGLEAGKTYIVKETVVPKGYNEPHYRYAMLIADRSEVQTYTFYNEPTPKIKTQAMFENGVKENSVDEETTVVDKVTLKKLVVGKEYTAKGKLVDFEDPTKVLAEGETTFVAESTEQTIEVKFKVNAKELAGTKSVVFEDLYRDGRKVASHVEVQDKDQTVYFPKVKTTASDIVDGKNDALAQKEVTIIDKVEYSNLNVGQEYTVKGILMNQQTNSPLLVNGNPVTAEKTFVAEKSNGFVEVEFKFDGSALVGQSVTVFEDLYNNGIKVATHSDITDEGQTVEFPDVKTKARDKETGLQVVKAEGTKTIVDKVSYKNLKIGKEYQVKGKLMDKATGNPILVNGKEVEASKFFTPETKDGFVELEFTVDASALVGKTTVVFEDVYRDGKLVGTHHDINDEEQTIYFPDAKTKVSSHTIKPNNDAKLVDTLTYTNLQVGKEYEVRGKLIDKATGQPILIDGKEVEVVKKFVPETTNGTVDIEFNFNAEKVEGKDIVVFEEVYLDGKLVAEHKDLNDSNQTFHVENKPVKPRTSQSDVNRYIYLGIALGCLGAVVVLTNKYLGKKRDEK